MNEIIPDSIEPIYGWRTFGRSGDGLQSPYTNAHWAPKETMVAGCTADRKEWVPFSECARGYAWMREWNVREIDGVWHIGNGSRDEVFDSPPSIAVQGGWVLQPLEHEAPAMDCTCGIYMLDSWEEALNYANAHFGRAILAKCAAWGTVIEGKTGLRCQYAYPVEFYFGFDEVSPGLASWAAIWGAKLFALQDLTDPTRAEKVKARLLHEEGTISKEEYETLVGVRTNVPEQAAEQPKPVKKILGMTRHRFADVLFAVSCFSFVLLLCLALMFSSSVMAMVGIPLASISGFGVALAIAIE